ncbi:MAG: hypothetical protein LUH22_05885 [Bacteroides sp.]|nr:hypothetical protein [Bacteroides sp.]
MDTNKERRKNKSAEERKLLLKSARTATARARKESIALNLPVQVISNGKLIERLPNGEIRVIKKIEKIKSNIPDLKKGMTICLKPKD